MRVAADRPVRFDMESLRVFVAVVEEGSIAAASGRTHLVASRVSKRVVSTSRATPARRSSIATAAACRRRPREKRSITTRSA